MRTRTGSNFIVKSFAKNQKVLRELHPGADFYGKKTDGIVTSSWEPLARIVVTDPASFRLDWSAMAMAKHTNRPRCR